MSGLRLVLSIFPGIDLLGRAFEEVFGSDICLVRGPDVLWGGDVKTFHPPAGVFWGIIGGPPCQCFSSLRHLNASIGRQMRHANLIPEFERVVDEACPDWFLMENVPQAPLPSVPGYQIDSMILNNRWVGGEQMRERRLSFGTLDGRRLDVSPDLCLFEAPVVEYAVTSSGGGLAGLKFDRGGTTRPTATVEKALAAAHRPVSRLLELQGLPPDLLDEAPFTDGGKREVIANGVPLFLGRALARAIKRAMEVSG